MIHPPSPKETNEMVAVSTVLPIAEPKNVPLSVISDAVEPADVILDVGASPAPAPPTVTKETTPVETQPSDAPTPPPHETGSSRRFPQLVLP